MKPDIYPVSPSRHANKLWTPSTSFEFAAHDSVVPLNAVEIAQAAKSMPCAFIQESGNFELVGILGLEEEENLLVSSNGSWIGRYLPERYRTYPFCLGMNANKDFVLCVDESSELVFDGDLNPSPVGKNKGFDFFSDDQTLSSSLNDVKATFDRIVKGRESTVRVCKFLEINSLIKPWSISLKNSAGSDSAPKEIEGLFCIDEMTLNGLDADRLVELRDLGGLWVAYCQLLSMTHLKGIGQLYSAKHKSDKVPEIRLDGDDFGSISFDNL